MDMVFIRGLSVSAIIGVDEWERLVKQTLVFNVELAADVARAAASDDLKDTVNYATVGDVIKEVIERGRFKLIETAAERVAERLMNDFQVTWLRLELNKPRPLSGGHVVGVAIERGTTTPPFPSPSPPQS